MGHYLPAVVHDKGTSAVADMDAADYVVKHIVLIASHQIIGAVLVLGFPQS